MIKKTTLIQGIGVAFILSIASIACAVTVSTLFGGFFGLKAVIALTGYIYTSYIISRSKTKTGRGTILGLAAVASGLALLGGCSVSAIVLLVLFQIWVVRSLYCYTSILSVLVDAVLCFFSIGCALWTFMLSGSLIAAIWSFFLTQALFVFIPANIVKRTGSEENSVGSEISTDSFARAHDAASQALRQIAQKI